MQFDLQLAQLHYCIYDIVRMSSFIWNLCVMSWLSLSTRCLLTTISLFFFCPESRCVWTWRAKMLPEKSRRSSRAQTSRLPTRAAAGEFNEIAGVFLYSWFHIFAFIVRLLIFLCKNPNDHLLHLGLPRMHLFEKVYKLYECYSTEPLRFCGNDGI